MGELKKVRAGESWRPDAKAHNAFVDAAQYVQRLQQSQAGNPVRGLWSGDIVQVKNMSGADRDRFDVLSTLVHWSPSGILAGQKPSFDLGRFQTGPVFVCDLPVQSQYNQIVILLEPIKSTKIGAAMIGGICPVQVSFDYATQPYADAKLGDASALQGGEGGSAQILWKESGTGVLWAIVRIGRSCYPTLFGTLDGALSAGGSAIMTEPAYGRKITVYDHLLKAGQSLPTGSTVIAQWSTWYLHWYALAATGSLS